MIKTRFLRRPPLPPPSGLIDRLTITEAARVDRLSINTFPRITETTRVDRLTINLNLIIRVV